MSKNGPILIIDDDDEDQEVLTFAFTSLKVKNDILFFNDGISALEFLRKNDAQPFIIFSDINMPRMDGFELRRVIDKDVQLKKKSIPFIFYTTHANKQAVSEAYDLTIQGFFVKPPTMEGIRETLKSILSYWEHCIHPNS